MSDAHRAEIAKLEALYAEHPEGRIFTHLAEACRKAGELERAHEVLTQGIERHPDYSSAHVVLGRVLMDMGRLDDAGREFHRVLDLDHHNLVALRSLGDIARTEGRMDEAQERYEQLLDLEPSDQEVRDLVEALQRGDEPASTSAATGEPAPDVAEGPFEAPEGPFEAPEGLEVDETAGAGFGEAGEVPTGTPEYGEDDAGAGAAELETDPWASDVDETEFGEEAPEEDFHVPDLAELEEEDSADYGDFGDVARELAASEGAAYEAESEPLDTEAEEVEGEVEVEEEWTVAADEAADWATGVESEPSSSEPLEPMQTLDEESQSGEGADVMTETIAQVYARQGLYDRAVEVYRELVRSRPDDEGLRERMADVERLAEVSALGEDAETAEPEEIPGLETGPLAEPDAEEMEPDTEPDAGVVAGFQATEFSSDAADVAPLEGLESRETDPETGLVAEPEEADEAEAGEEAAAAVGDEEAVEEEAEAAEEAELEAEEAELETEEASASPWTDEAWTPAEEEPETPYAWAESDESEDGSPPIGDYLTGLLSWGGGSDEAVPGADELGAGADEEAGSGGSTASAGPDTPAGTGDDDDDDLEMFRSWLESLKQ